MFCPNKNCINYSSPKETWYRKKGYYKTRHNGQPVPRYQCKVCKQNFSSHTFLDTHRQHRPEVNLSIFKMLCGGISQRRCAKILGIHRRTIIKRFRWLAFKARTIHEDFLKSGVLKTNYVQFDEMQSYEFDSCLPLSIALAVRYKTGQIIDAQVGQHNATGYLANLAHFKYEKRADTRERACRETMQRIKLVASNPGITIATDKRSAYRTIIVEEIPKAQHKTKSRVKNEDRDPLFILNQKCAKARHDNARLHRCSWATSKRAWGLQMQLDLFIAAENRYNLKVPVFGKYTGQEFYSEVKAYCKALQEKHPFIGPTNQPKTNQMAKKLKCRRERVREELKREFVAYGWKEKDFEF